MWGGGCGTGYGVAARGLGAIGGGLWSEGSEEEEKSEQRSGNTVLGGWPRMGQEYLRSRTGFTEKGSREKSKESLNIRDF